MNKPESATDFDRQTIERLGGPTKLAELLGYDKAKGGVQRIQNWKTRGIPPSVKIARPDLFMPGLNSTQPDAVATSLSPQQERA